MKTIAYFDCYSGASGDMLLASLVDNTVDFNWFKKELEKLNIPKDSFSIEKHYVQRSTISSCKVDITFNHRDKMHRSYSTICKIIDDSQINESAKELAKKIFYKLGKAEAKIHQKDIEKIHFHEVGAMDSIIDIVGFSICYASLNIDKCIVSPLPLGSGEIKCAHGILPVPAPATVEILKDHDISIKNAPEIKEECLTPTGAAILCSIADECSTIPDMSKILNIGYGAGSKVFQDSIISNLRFVLGKISD